MNELLSKKAADLTVGEVQTIREELSRVMCRPAETPLREVFGYQDPLPEAITVDILGPAHEGRAIESRKVIVAAEAGDLESITNYLRAHNLGPEYGWSIIQATSTGMETEVEIARFCLRFAPEVLDGAPPAPRDEALGGAAPAQGAE